jgi:uncharacterized membrane protein YbhN (UPF0104 family)
LDRLPVAVTVALAGTLFVLALAVMSAVAGWDTVVGQLRPRLSFWFAVAFAAELIAFVAYVFAYRAVAHIENGPRIGWLESASVVAVGFGAFLVKGGGALDSKVLRGNGSKQDGEVRVLALDALEHAPLAPAACAAAIDLLVEGQRKPGLDFSIPWATLVPIGAVAAAVGVRHRDRFLGRDGWRGQLGQALEGIRLLFRLAAGWRGNWLAFLGASVYWAGDVACLWASLKPFGATPTLPAIVLAHAVGYVLTRRTLPFAGAGIVEVLMPLTLLAAGASFAGAVLGVIVYRIFNLWLPLIPALAALPTVRRSFKLELSMTSAQP